MDTGTAIETKDEAIQPEQVVETNSEITEANPQAEATDEQEFYVDDSSDDQESHKTEMTQAQSYAAFQKKKKQSAQRKKELDASQERETKLQREVDELKAAVGKMTKGKPPTLDQFDFDEGQYQAAMQEYYATPSAKPAKKEEASTEAVNPANDEAEFYLYQREQELTKAIPAYEQAKTEVAELLGKHGIDDSAKAFNYLSIVAKQKNVDVAKVIFAINKSPKILDDILAAGSSDIAVADILAKAEGKVKTRSKKKIESEPEPTITNSGAINSGNEQIKQARAKWIANPTTSNYNAYQSAKNKKGE